MTFLKNKRGDSYIYLCVIVLFISMLTSVVILYMGLTAQVQVQKRDVQLKLDSYIADCSPEVYDALKQGSAYETYVDWEAFEQGAYKTLGFERDTTSEYSYGNCTMTRPILTVLKGNGCGITAEYTAVFPVRWNGNVYADLEIPVTVTSYYKLK